ncbi:hypothetical protein ACTFIV_005121, partial [Dictyostelium citrinum]|jgi:hypothetical protein
VNN